jgi:uncharacterized protein YjbJ (UPF0337 family)
MEKAQDFGTAAQKAKGRLKEAVGDATGDEQMAARGRGEQVAARMKEAAEKVVETTKQAAADLTQPDLTGEPDPAAEQVAGKAAPPRKSGS